MVFHKKVKPFRIPVGATRVCSQKTDNGHSNELFIILFIFISNHLHILNPFYHLDAM